MGNERSEGILEEHARDFAMTVELALAEDGTFLSLRVLKRASVGAYLNNFGPLPAIGNLGRIAGVYKTPAIQAEITGVFTNSAPTSPYRGVERPEATLAIEQVIDLASRVMGDRQDRAAPSQYHLTGLHAVSDRALL